MRRIFEKWYVDVGQKIQLITYTFIYTMHTCQWHGRYAIYIYIYVCTCIYIYTYTTFEKNRAEYSVLNTATVALLSNLWWFSSQLISMVTTCRLVLAPHRHSGPLFVGSFAAMNSMEPFQQQACPRSQRLEKEI